MADGINLPSNLYTAGAVALNVEPSTQFAAQLALKKQAREDALNEYYQNSHKDANPDGVRPGQDMSDYLQKYNDWQQHYNQNKEQILNPTQDNGAALSQDNSMYQDMLSFINQSKQRQAANEQIFKLRADPRTNYLFDNDAIIPALHQNNLPVNSPGSKQLDVNALAVNTQPLAAKDLMALNSSYMKGITPSPQGKGIPQPDGTILQPMGYTPEDKQKVAKDAMGSYVSDRRIQAHSDRSVENPALYAQANAAFVDLYNRPIQTPMDYYVGEQLSMAGLNRVDNKRVNDPAAMANLRARNSLYNQETLIPLRLGATNAARKFGIDYAKSSAQDQTNINESYVDGDFQRAQNPQLGGKTTVGPDGQLEYVSPGDAILEKTLATGVGKAFSKPDEIRYNQDGSQVRGVFYIRDTKTGRPIPNGQGGFQEDPNKGGWMATTSVKQMVGKEFGKLALPSQTPKAETYPTDTNPANWKQAGNNYQYKDGSIWDANGKRVN